MGEIGRVTFIRHLGIGVEYRNCDFKRFICNNLAILHKNLVKFGPVTPEFKKGKDVPYILSSIRSFAMQCNC